MITDETVIDFFEDIKANNSFDLQSKLLWGYFFLSENKNQLEEVRKYLEKMDYVYVDIFDAEKEDINDEDEFYLHMEKREKQNVETLLQRNKELYSIADSYNVTYDGFDVGN